MYRFTLTYKNESLILTNPPEGWNNLQLTYTRSEKYWGIIRTVTAALQFVKEGKVFIDAAVSDNINAEILCKIDIYDNITRRFFTIMNGVCDVSTFVRKELFTEVNIIDGSFQQKLFSRDANEVSYQSTKTVDNGTVYKFSDEQVLATLRGSVYENETTCNCVYPFNLFSRIINILTNVPQRLKSSVLDHRNLVIDGSYNLGWHVLTMGSYLRKFPSTFLDAENETNGGYCTMTTSLEKLFTSFGNIFNLGLSVEDTFDENGGDTNPIVVIEDKKYFFQETVILQIDTLSDLEFSIDEKLMFSSIDVGYNNTENDNPYGQDEYNNMASYSTPLIPFSTKLELTSEIRADGTAIEQLRLNPVDDDREEMKNDKDMFIISCVKNSTINNGNLTSLRNEDTIITNLYTESFIIYNTDLIPGRILQRWGDIISIGLQKNKTDYLTFQKSEKPIAAITNKDGDIIYENTDLLINALSEPYLKGYTVRFNAPVGLTEIRAIESNKNGLVKFWNYIDKKYQYGWIREVSTNPVDKTTNWELMLAVKDNFDTFGYWLAENGTYIISESDSTLILNEKQ